MDLLDRVHEQREEGSSHHGQCSLDQKEVNARFLDERIGCYSLATFADPSGLEAANIKASEKHVTESQNPGED